MLTIKLKYLLKDVEHSGLYDGESDIKYITTLVSECRPDCVYVAVKGKHFDGNLNINSALEKGAAVITEKETGIFNVICVKNALSAYSFMCAGLYKIYKNTPTLIGITGTNGKTTTAHILAHILNYNNVKTAVLGTIENKNTTPEPSEFFSRVKALSEAGHRCICCEVSSQGLEQHRVDACKFDFGAFLGLGNDHLDWHGNVREYFESKKRLVPLCNYFLTNVDDEYGKLLSQGNRTFSLTEKSDYRASGISYSSEGTEFDFSEFGYKKHIKTSFFGEYNVYNTVAALGLARMFGLSIGACAEALKQKIYIPGRCEELRFDSPFRIFVDFAHTPQALKSVLVALRKLTEGKLIAVFGCGGDRDREKRPIMGRIASVYADYTVLTSDNPRSENPMSVLEEIRCGAVNENHTVIEDRECAIEYACNIAREGDIVLIAGKGHEKYQITSDVISDFDDCEKVGKIMKNKGFSPYKE